MTGREIRSKKKTYFYAARYRRTAEYSEISESHRTREEKLANHPSALKRARQSEKRRARNASRKTRVKNVIKKVLKAVESKNQPEARQAVKEAMPFIYKAGSKGVIHKRKASRQVSRLMRRVNKLQAQA